MLDQLDSHDTLSFICAGSTDAAVIAMTSETERKRQNHIHELISTEESYRKDLTVMLEVHLHDQSEHRTFFELQ